MKRQTSARRADKGELLTRRQTSEDRKRKLLKATGRSEAKSAYRRPSG